MELLHRPRRLRRTQALRNLVRETRVHADNLIYPMFIEEEISAPVAISSMPGIVRHPEKDLAAAVKEAYRKGVKSFMFFGVSHKKDASGSDSLKADGLLARMIERAKQAVPEAVIISDNCFCEYTDHGHCGPVDARGHVDNDATLENLARQAVVCAQAGADMVAPSAMMDGQIAAMRKALDDAGYAHTPIMAYASKMASACYGPFRAAAGCDLKGDRKTYQLDPANGREALYEAELDEAEGADILMVKPGLMYLDVLANLRALTHKPLAAYQVSGEYAMIKFAAENGALDEKRIVLESLVAFKRAGATAILTYFAPEAAQWVREEM
jgi:porphobilinogen synthase